MRQRGSSFAASHTMSALAALAIATAAHADPEWLGNTATVYTTVTDPFEIVFGTDGVLFAGHNSPSNGAADIYRIPPGGTASPFGSLTPEDPDGIDFFAGYVYASSEGPIYRTDMTTGTTTIWANAGGSLNQSSIVIDKDGVYFGVGTAIVGNARASADIQLLFEANPPQTLVSSSSLSVVRALQFAAGGLYFTEALEDLGVWSITAAGVITKVPDGGHAWSVPEAMAYHASSDSFIVGDGANLYSLPRTGGVVQQVGSGFGQISGMTFDDDGRLFVADDGEDVIWMIVPGAMCPACAADYDNNGGVDGGDLGAFFADFETGAPCADVDQNGGVDGGDLGFFFQVFEAGGC